MTDRTLLLVVGAGRSGTSSFAGAMNHLGFHVPPPVVGAAASNPRGHFEPLWAVKFHNRILEGVGYGPVDGDPLAGRRILEAALTDDYRRELGDWLSQVPESETRIIVKDPRSVWVAPLWDEVASALGFRVVYVTMLREPAGVVGSHSTHYAHSAAANQQLRSDTATLAGWINLNLVAEEVSRGKERKSVLYNDLLADWRATLRPLDDALDLSLDVNADNAGTSAVDEFLDPDLHRVRKTWEGSRIPVALRTVADALWDDLVAHAHGEMDEASYIQRIQGHRSDFTILYTAAEMIARDRTRRTVANARREGYREALDAVRVSLDALG